MAGGQIVDARPLAGAVTRQERLGDDLERVEIGIGVAHDTSPSPSPGRSATNSASRSGARVYRCSLRSARTAARLRLVSLPISRAARAPELTLGLAPR